VSTIINFLQTKGQPMISAELIQLFRSLKKSAIILLLMKWVGKPMGEAEVAAVLDSSRTTVRTQLNSLCALGFARRVRFHDGFELTELGQGLFQNEEGKFCPLPTDTDLNVLNSKIDSKTEAVAAVKKGPVDSRPPPAAPEPVDPQIEAALRKAGIMLNARTRALARMEHITPEYIRAHHHYLYVTRGTRSPGLLVSILESAQPLPDSARCERRDYLSGEYADFVEH
jgi:biotin operon repressor